jgi:class 3 adenylate cyclase
VRRIAEDEVSELRFREHAGIKFCGECAEPLAPALACPRCGTANPKGRRFCDSCAQPLAEASAPDPRSYLPKHLAEKILTSRGALEGERKQVTVLFADVKGSMDLAEHVDPEEWHKIMDRFFAILSEGVHRFEGNINQYTGDGIMALFGAPIAHEDHAQRACYAALATGMRTGTIREQRVVPQRRVRSARIQAGEMW